jgi:hypothetical protein
MKAPSSTTIQAQHVHGTKNWTKSENYYKPKTWMLSVYTELSKKEEVRAIQE